MRNFAVMVLVALFIGATQQARAEDGAVVIRIDDGVSGSHCISPDEKLRIVLRRVVIEKQSKYLGLIQDASLGLTLTTTVSGSSDGDTKSASFTKITNEALEQLNAGQVSLAREKSLLSDFALTNGTNVFSVIELDVGVVKTSGKSDAAKILMAAVGGTSSLNLPPNPFTQAFGVATAYVKNFVQPLIDQAANQKEATSYTISMNIGPANCQADSEQPGTKAILSAASDASKPGAVDIAHVDDYCFSAALKPAFVLKAAKKPANGKCESAVGATEVSNSYLAFYVNAWSPTPPKPDKPAIAAATIQSTDPAKVSQLKFAMRQKGFGTEVANLFSEAVLSLKSSQEVGKLFRLAPSVVDGVRESLQRCDANGTPADQCL